jgi:hypothetical protein
VVRRPSRGGVGPREVVVVEVGGDRREGDGLVGGVRVGRDHRRLACWEFPWSCICVVTR